MGTGYLIRSGLATSEPERAITLTPDGLDASDGYRHWAARGEDRALGATLEAVVTQRDALAVGLVAGEVRSRTLRKRAACWLIQPVPCHGSRWSCIEEDGPMPASAASAVRGSSRRSRPWSVVVTLSELLRLGKRELRR
jgi:hypothetical protein